jgi:hypothetical protein
MKGLASTMPRLLVPVLAGVALGVVLQVTEPETHPAAR